MNRNGKKRQSFNRLVAQSLYSSVIDNRIDIIKNLIPLCHPMDIDFALNEAIKHGHTRAAELLELASR